MSTEEKINEILSITKTTASQVSDLRRAVFGNGRPGLTDRMAVLEQQHMNLQNMHETCPAKEAISGAARRQDTANRVSIGAFIVAAIAALLAWMRGA